MTESPTLHREMLEKYPCTPETTALQGDLQGRLLLVSGRVGSLVHVHSINPAKQKIGFLKNTSRTCWEMFSMVVSGSHKRWDR